MAQAPDETPAAANGREPTIQYGHLNDVDFEAAYRGGSLAEGMPDQSPAIPWDIGGPQPVLVEVEAEGDIRGNVLDVGCGLGDNAIFLAECGYRVTAVDGAPTAVERAGQRAAARGVEVSFAVADATRLPGYDNCFDTVIDSALFHCLDPDQRRDYVAALRRVTVVGATLHVFCSSDAGPANIPHPVSEATLWSSFDGWRIDDLTTTLYTAAFDRDQVAALLTAQGDSLDALDHLTFDDAGRLRFPVWKLAATRL